MKTISDQLDDIKDKTKQIPVLDGELSYWENNNVTKRFMMEMQLSLMSTFEYDDFGEIPENIDSIALKSAYFRGMRNVFSLILEWKPSDLDF